MNLVLEKGERVTTGGKGRGEIGGEVLRYFPFHMVCIYSFLLLECSAEAFQCHVHHYQCLMVLVEKLLLNTELSKDFD